MRPKQPSDQNLKKAREERHLQAQEVFKNKFFLKKKKLNKMLYVKTSNMFITALY